MLDVLERMMLPAEGGEKERIVIGWRGVLLWQEKGKKKNPE
jgi:hypothetical protein